MGRDEVELFELQRDEPEPGVAGDGVERDAPVGASLAYGGGDCMVLRN